MYVDDEMTKVLVTGFVVWDGIHRVENLDDGGKKHSLKIAIDPNNQELQELNEICNKELHEGEFKGNLPNGANWAIGQANPQDSWFEYFPNFACINAVTYNGTPPVYDAVNGGDPLQPMVYDNHIYTGAKVALVVSARTYNNKSKGIGFWLNGIGVFRQDPAPKLNIGSAGGFDAQRAFGRGNQGQQHPQGGYQQQQPNQGQQHPQGSYQQQQPNQQQPNQGQQHPQGSYQQQQPNQQQPNQGQQHPQGSYQQQQPNQGQQHPQGSYQQQQPNQQQPNQQQPNQGQQSYVPPHDAQPDQDFGGGYSR